MTDKCQFPRCRSAPSLGYMGRALCREHANLILGCDLPDDLIAEDRFLSAIGLRRDGEGFVVEQEDTR